MHKEVLGQDLAVSSRHPSRGVVLLKLWPEKRTSWCSRTHWPCMSLCWAERQGKGLEASTPTLCPKKLAPPSEARQIWGLRHWPAWLPPPCPPSSCYLECFFRFEDPVLSSETESGQKWGPNCAHDVPVRGARALRTGTLAAQLGPHFGLIGTRRGRKPK